MEDVTNLFINYRECVRHLWNTYFQPVADWDVRDEFDAVSRDIFSSLVLRSLDMPHVGLSPESSEKPTMLPGFRIIPSVEHGTEILINRDLPRSGYWDHPVSRVRPDEVELHLLRFFDFDQLGNREYRYLEVFVHASPKYPDIVGRAALIEFVNTKILFSKPRA
jgi:hypothetical protein